MYDPVSYVDDDGQYMSGREIFREGSAPGGAVMEEIVEEIVEELEEEAKKASVEREK